MDALVASVGLFLLANLIGLILRLWACFAKFKALVPIPSNRSRFKALLFFSSSTACDSLSVLLLRVQRAVVAASSLVLRVQIPMGLQHWTSLVTKN